MISFFTNQNPFHNFPSLFLSSFKTGRIFLAIFIGIWSFSGFAQTILIKAGTGGPTSSGGFENAVPTGVPVSDFSSNNWVVVNGSNNRFWVGNAGTPAGGNYHAFTGPNGFSFSGESTSSVSHIYRDITIPAGEPLVTVSLKYKVTVVDAGFDFLKVHVVPTSTIPVAGTQLATGQLGANTDGSTIYSNYSFSGLQTPGSTVRVVISWRSDGIPPHAAGALDDIEVSSSAIQNFSATTQGGLWNSPATWVGGVVPPTFSSVVIPAGSHVMLNTSPNIYDLTVNGDFSFANANTLHIQNDFTIGSTGRALLTTIPIATLNSINIRGNFVNNGYCNASYVNLLWPNTVVGNCSISGTGTFESGLLHNRGIIRTLSAQNLGNFTVNTAQNLTIAGNGTSGSGLIATCNNLNTNGKIRVENVPCVLNSIKFGVVTNMGAGYTASPWIAATSAAVWAPGAIGVGAVRVVGGQQYVSLDATGATAGNAPSHSDFSVQVTGDGKNWLHVGSVGYFGNALCFNSLTPVSNIQYFWNGALYTCINAVPMTIAQIAAAVPGMSTTVGSLVSIGSATFRCVGTPAIFSPNYDSLTQTLRSITVSSSGSGYQENATLTVLPSNGVNPSTTAIVNTGLWVRLPGNYATIVKATASTITGGIDKFITTGIAGSGINTIVTPIRGHYLSTPSIGFTIPTIYNLVTNQGSGYTSVPSVNVSGGTNVNGGSLPTFTVNVAEGRVISIYPSSIGTACWSSPPTLTISGGGGSGATASFGTSIPTATVEIDPITRQVVGYTITNQGEGYTSGPAFATTPPIAGLETGVGAGSVYLGDVYGQLGFYIPQNTNPLTTHLEIWPSNNRIMTLDAAAGFILHGNAECYGSAPLNFSASPNLGGFNLFCSNPNYGGYVPTTNTQAYNGSIELSLPGGQASATRTFLLGGGGSLARYGVFVTGTGVSVVGGGYTYTRIRATSTGAPSGTVFPAGNMTGSRTMHLEMLGLGAMSNNNTGKTFQLFWNANDNFVSNAPSIFLAESSTVSGPWTIRSNSSGTGPLPANGSRTSATLGPGPISNSNDYYFGFANNGFTPPAPLSYSVSRTTSNTYNSIAPNDPSAGYFGDGTGLPFTGWVANIANDEEWSGTVSLADPSNAFAFQGLPFSGFRVHTNGFLQLDNGNLLPTSANLSSTPAFDNNFSSSSITNVVAPFWEDLVNRTTGGNSRDNSIRYKITGTAPNRVIIVEWANMNVYGSSGPRLYFQVVLMEADNSIRYSYGDMELFNGLANTRYSYSLGLNGGYSNPFPQVGQVFAQVYENTTAFDHFRTQTANIGSNGLSHCPEPRSSILFTPGVYGGYSPPGTTPPSNDNVVAALTISPLAAIPENIAWNSLANQPNYFTSRYATHSPQPVCGGPTDGKDVWFKFMANSSDMVVAVVGSGGYDPRVQILDQLLNPMECKATVSGARIEIQLVGLTLGNDYYVRVCHNFTGATASFSSGGISSGAVTSISLLNPGSNYSQATAVGGPVGKNFNFTGGGGTNFIGAITGITNGGVSGLTFNGGNDFSSSPAIAIESPDWGISGEFALLVYPAPLNDDCATALMLSNTDSASCTTNENRRVGVSTTLATSSPDPLGACSSGADDDVWFKFEGTGGVQKIEVKGNGLFDPAFQVWTQSSGNCATKNLLPFPIGGCVNETGPGGSEMLNLKTTPGNTYFIRVYHVGAGSGDPAGFDICVNQPIPSCSPGPLFPPIAAQIGSLNPIIFNWLPDPNALVYDLYLTGPSASAFTNITGATYETGPLLPGNYSWTIIPKNANGFPGSCTTWNFSVINPQPTSTTAGFSCSPGTVNLSATAAPGDLLNWYNVSTGGSVLGSGTTFTTPIIGSTTTFYVEANSPGNGLFSIGNNTSTQGGSGLSPFSGLYEGQRTQYLIREPELVAAGLQMTSLTNLNFYIISLNTNFPLLNFTIRVGTTATTSFSGAFLSPTFTTVFNSSNYQPVVGLNHFQFSIPYFYSTGNLVVEVCFENDPTGSLGPLFSANSVVRATNTGFNSVFGRYADNLPMCGTNNGTAASSQIRPDFYFNDSTFVAGSRQPVLATIGIPPFPYNVHQQTGLAYTPLSGATTIPRINLDDATYHSLGESTGPDNQPGFPIGFSFVYQGFTYNDFVVNSNGWVKLGNGNISWLSAMGYNVMNSAEQNVLVPYNGNLKGDLPFSAIRYQLQGVPGSRKLIIEYKDFRSVNASQEVYLNFQVQLWEADNSIHFRYGPSTLQNLVTRYIGIKGICSSTSSQNVNALTSSIATDIPFTSDIFRTSHQNGAGAGIGISAANTSGGLNGLEFYWTTTPCLAEITVLQSPTINAYNDVYLNWLPAVGELNGYEVRYKRAIDPITAYTTVMVPHLVTTLQLTTLLPNTIYQFEVAAHCASRPEFSVSKTFGTDAAEKDISVVGILNPSPSDVKCLISESNAVATFKNEGSLTILGPVVVPVKFYIDSDPAMNGSIILGPFDTWLPGEEKDVDFGPISLSTGVHQIWAEADQVMAIDAVAANNILPQIIISVFPPLVTPPDITSGLGVNSFSEGWSMGYVSGQVGWSLASATQPLWADVGSANLGIAEGGGFGFFDPQTVGTSVSRLISRCIFLDECYTLHFRHSKWNAQANASGTQIKVYDVGLGSWSPSLEIYNPIKLKSEGFQVNQFSPTASTPSWQDYVVDLSSFKSKTIQIAFEGHIVGYGGLGQPGFGVDHMQIKKGTLKDLGIAGFGGLFSDKYCAEDLLEGSVKLENFGCADHYPSVIFSIHITGDENIDFEETLDLDINPGELKSFTIGQLELFRPGGSQDSSSIQAILGSLPEGVYFVSFQISAPGDGNSANDFTTPVRFVVKRKPQITNTISPSNIVEGSGLNVVPQGLLEPIMPYSIFSNKTSLSIPDGPGLKGIAGGSVNSTIATASLPAGLLANTLLAVNIHATHPHSSDLNFVLHAPNGSQIMLNQPLDQPGRNVIGLRFVASGVGSVSMAYPPYSGDYMPLDAISSLSGLANGTWTLEVFDNEKNGTGALVNWSLEFPGGLAEAKWECITCPATPQTFPVISNYPGDTIPHLSPIGATYATGVYPIKLSVTDWNGCQNMDDEYLNVFSTNRWLGLIDGTDNWQDVSNWQSAPAPPNHFTSVSINSNTPFEPQISSTAYSGMLHLINGAKINLLNQSSPLELIADITGQNGKILGPGILKMNGLGIQKMLGQINIQNLEIDKASGQVHVDGKVSLSGTLSMASASSSILVNPLGKLTLISNATATGRIGPIPNGASIIGNLTQERWFPRNLAPGTKGSWYFIASPITGKNFTDWVDNFKVVGLNTGFGVQGSGIINAYEPERSTIFKYVENQHPFKLDTVQKDGWRIPGNENIFPGAGYRVWVDYYSNSLRKVDHTGPVVFGNFSFPSLTRTHHDPCWPTDPSINPTVCNESNRGWNLLGNPYPCEIDWDSPHWNKPAEMNNAFFTWNSVLGGYRAYAGTGGSVLGVSPSLVPNPHLIPSSQAFFVRLNSPGTYPLSVTENAKSTSMNGSFVRTGVAMENYLELNLKRQGDEDGYEFRSALWVHENGTPQFDPNLDIPLLKGQRPEISFSNSGGQWIRNTMGPLTQSEVIPLHISYQGYFGQFSLSFLHLQSFNQGTEIYLKDKYLNYLHPVAFGAYVFSSIAEDGSSTNDRFELLLVPGIQTNVKNEKGMGYALILPNPSNQGQSKSLFIQGHASGTLNLNILDVLGRKLAKETYPIDEGSATVEIKNSLPSGVYWIEVKAGTFHKVLKMVVR